MQADLTRAAMARAQSANPEETAAADRPEEATVIHRWDSTVGGWEERQRIRGDRGRSDRHCIGPDRQHRLVELRVAALPAAAEVEGCQVEVQVEGWVPARAVCLQTPELAALIRSAERVVERRRQSLARVRQRAHRVSRSIFLRTPALICGAGDAQQRPIGG